MSRLLIQVSIKTVVNSIQFCLIFFSALVTWFAIVLSHAKLKRKPYYTRFRSSTIIAFFCFSKKWEENFSTKFHIDCGKVENKRKIFMQRNRCGVVELSFHLICFVVYSMYVCFVNMDFLRADVSSWFSFTIYTYTPKSNHNETYHSRRQPSIALIFFGRKDFFLASSLCANSTKIQFSCNHSVQNEVHVHYLQH